MNDPTNYYRYPTQPTPTLPSRDGAASATAIAGGALGGTGALLVWLSLVLPWWEVPLFGSLTLWQMMSLDDESSAVVGLAILTLVISGLVAVSGGVVGVAVRTRVGLIVAGVGGSLAGSLVGAVLLYVLVGLSGDSSGLVQPGVGLVVAGFGCLLLLGGGVLAFVSAAIAPSRGAAGAPTPYAVPGGHA